MKFARYAVLLLAALVCSAVLGCRSRSLPATPPLNAAERALQRVVLPGICEFDGRPVNPTNLLAWLSTEATKHDPAARKVTIRIDVDKSDAPPVGQSTQTTFQYRASGGRLSAGTQNQPPAGTQNQPPLGT